MSCIFKLPDNVSDDDRHFSLQPTQHQMCLNKIGSLRQDSMSTGPRTRLCCSSNSPPPLRAAINQACSHLSGVVDDLQPVPVSVHEVPSLETFGQQNGAPVPDAAVGLAAAMPNNPEEEARILRLTQLINARHGAAKPQHTIQAEKSAAKLWRVGAAWPSLLFYWRP